MNPADTQAMNPDPLFNGAVNLLKFGPLGLAGLMLVLVIVALTIRDLKPPTERLLRLFLYVGAFCFVVSSVLLYLSPATAISRTLRLEVYPNSLANSDLPEPVIKVDKDKVKYPLKYSFEKAEIVIDVDVTASIEAIKSQKQALTTVAQTSGESLANVKRLQGLVQQVSQLLDNPCSGGSNGKPIVRAKEVNDLLGAINTGLLDSIGTAKAASSL